MVLLLGVLHPFPQVTPLLVLPDTAQSVYDLPILAILFQQALQLLGVVRPGPLLLELLSQLASTLNLFSLSLCRWCSRFTLSAEYRLL